jgi:23S rRNA pseudouridine2605 synthase
MNEPIDPETASPSAEPRIRLQRYLAACGLGSRRACEELITEGRITIDGETVIELGTTVNPSVQKITYDGERLRMERKKYYLFNKPTGILCTNNDPKRRPLVVDFFPDEGPRLFTVGRLDEDSEGLLLVTNDGDLAQRMAHPRYRIYRTYSVQVAGFPTRETFDEMKRGVYFPEGRFKVLEVRGVRRQGQSMWLEVVLSEGHNREIRRMFARMGHKVMRLERIAFGPLTLGKLKRGEFRELRHEELERLHAVLAKAQGQATSGRTRSERPGAAPKKRAVRSEAGGEMSLRPTRESSRTTEERRPARSTARPDRPLRDRPPRDREAGDRPVRDRAPREREAGERPLRDRAPRVREAGDRPVRDRAATGERRPAKAGPAKARPARSAEAASRRPSLGEKRPSHRSSSGEAKRRTQRKKKPRRGEGRG